MESVFVKLPAFGKNAANHANTKKICAQCRDALDRRFQQPQVQTRDQHWTAATRYEIEQASRSIWTLSYLRTSRAACPFCQFLIQMTEDDPGLAGRSIEDDGQLLLAPYKAGSVHLESTLQIIWRWRISIRIPTPPPSWSKEEFVWEYLPTSLGSLYPLPDLERGAMDPQGQKIFHGRKMGPLVDWTLVRAWHTGCAGQHTKTDPLTYLGGPTHLAALSTCNEPSQPFDMAGCVFRLVDVNRHCVVPVSLKPKYASLSYVWGNTPRFLLQGSNVAELQTTDSLKRLAGDVPKTFLDSMEVTRQLGLDFLWIDALCIVQDDAADIQSHLARMDVIYNNAELTIVSAGPNAAEGLPGCQGNPRPPRQLEFAAEGVALVNTQPGFAETVSRSAWESRGWTFQEKVFSRRMLVFTDLQAFWQCHEATWFEDTVLEPWEDNVTAVRLGERRHSMSKGFSSTLELTHGVHLPPSRHRYRELVAAYLHRQLSFPEDILNAFRGVLKQQVESDEGGDLWGIPRKHLAATIGWRHDTTKGSNRRPGFPSWSWAGWITPAEARIAFRETPNFDTVLEPRYRRFLDGEWADIRPPPAPSRFPPRFPREAFVLHYGIPHHPGGSRYVERDLPPFEHDPAAMPPLSHLLRFWTSSAMLDISAERISGDADGLSSYEVFVPGTGRLVSHITLDPAWVARNPGPAEFIVVSPGVALLGEALPRPEHVGLNVLLIERQGPVACRVQMCEYTVGRDVWKKAMPYWKPITLG